nr:MAG TPA: hypothetical protein [Caudoviricetes sp.]
MSSEPKGFCFSIHKNINFCLTIATTKSVLNDITVSIYDNFSA